MTRYNAIPGRANAYVIYSKDPPGFDPNKKLSNSRSVVASSPKQKIAARLTITDFARRNDWPVIKREEVLLALELDDESLQQDGLIKIVLKEELRRDNLYFKELMLT